MKYQIYRKDTDRVVLEGSKEEVDAGWRDMCRKFREKYSPGSGMMLYDYYGVRCIKDDNLQEGESHIGLNEKQLIASLQQLRRDWMDRFGLENEAASMAVNDILDFIWDIKKGKYDSK